jgi:hypothetical protein
MELKQSVPLKSFHLIGKETERGWEQAEDISTLLPSLVRYRQNNGEVPHLMRAQLQQISLNILESKTGSSRHTILRARRGKPVHPKIIEDPPHRDA